MPITPPKSPSQSPASGLPLDKLVDQGVPAEEIDQLADSLDIVMDDETGELVQNPDGSMDLLMKDEEHEDVPFRANLAEHLDEAEMQDLARDLQIKIEADKQAREKRDEQYEEGLRRTGMGNDAPGGAAFKGASRVVHPMLVEACVDFCAAASKELCPPSGPAKTQVEGQISAHKYAVSQRQERYLNWQLRTQISEFIEEFEQLLTQLPMGGSQYLKFWYDRTLKRICCEFVPIDDVFLPYACTDFYTAQRITHVQRLTQHVLEDRIEDGFYRDITEGGTTEQAPSTHPDKTKAGAANDKVEGRDEDQDNVDGERIVYEVNTFAKLSIDNDEKLPYLISIDETSGKIVSIYRNWEEKDDACQRLDWIVEFGFIAWRGAYKIGMPHLIGGLSAAATGALRAILDSAHFNNMPGFLKLKGARVGGQTKEVNPAQGVEIEGTGAVDDIRKLVMALPYNQPSVVLFQLLGWLTDAAKGVVTTAEEKIADATNQMPVGTALALMESGAKVYSSIHSRLHRSMTRAFAILARLNKKHLSIGEQLTKLGEVLATRNDFAEPLAVIPVSDPNIFSEAQRFAQMQMVMSLAQGVDPKTGQPTATAALHNLYEATKRLYEIAKIPDFDKFLPAPSKPEQMNAAAENVAATMNRPLMAFPDQDHFAHIETHLRYITDPFLGGSGMAAHQTMPMMMEHVKQHLGYLYLDLLGHIIQTITGESVEELTQDKGGQEYLDKLIAGASKIVHTRLQARLQPLGPVVQQVLQQIAQMQPPQPMDPSQAVIQTEKMKQQGKAAETDKKLAAQQQLKAAELQQKGQQHSEKIGLEHDKLAVTASQKADELELQAQTHGATLDHETESQVRDMAHEAMQGDLERQEADRARQHQQQMAEVERQHEADQAQAQRMHEAQSQAAQQDFDGTQAAAEQHAQAIEAANQRAHDQQQSAVGQAFEADQAAAARAHEASLSDAQRKSAERQHHDKLKDSAASRKHAEKLARTKAAQPKPAKDKKK